MMSLKIRFSFLMMAFSIVGCEGILVGPSRVPLQPVSGGGTEVASAGGSNLNTGGSTTGGGAGGAAGGTAGGTGVVQPEEPAMYQCNSGAVAEHALNRLTDTQYRRTLEAALSVGLTPSELSTLMAVPDVSNELAAIPRDGRPGHLLIYDTQDQRISRLLVEPQLNIAIAVATWISSDAPRLQRFVRANVLSGCAANITDAACVSSFLSNYGSRVLRRTLTATDLAFYQTAYTDTTYGGYRALIGQLLAAPDFVFQTEFHGTDVVASTRTVEISSEALANRMSYMLTAAPPDEALRASAKLNFVGATNTLEFHANRLLKSPAAKENFERFFRQWLRLEQVPSFNPSVQAVLSLAYPDNASQPIASTTDLSKLRLDAFDEMVALATHFSFDRPGTLKDIVTSDVSLARSSDLAKLYGVVPWSGPESDGSIDVSKLVKFGAQQRSGLFTRAGFLISGFPDTRPIWRGARLRTEYLCTSLTPPGDTRPPMNYMAPAIPSTRNLVVAKTEIADSACHGCHKSLINPLGFALENYDAFGRVRNVEPLFSAMGAVTGWTPVKSDAVPDLVLNGNTTQVNNGVELSALLASSDRFYGCFSRDLFRYMNGREEQTSTQLNTDGCALQALQTRAKTQPLQSVFSSFVLSPEFKTRHYGREN